MTNPIFVSIDTTDINAAKALAHNVQSAVGGIKLGLEFFSAHGPAGVAYVVGDSKLALFIDLKLHDIPNTVAGAMRGLIPLKPDIVTIHAAGGVDMIRAARDSARSEADKLGINPPKVVAVTVLTSLDQAGVESIGITRSVVDQVVGLAEMAVAAGADGLVCSPLEVEALRLALGAVPLLVVPGIRPKGSEVQDQKRIMTPVQAMAAGADILVIGRPITQSPDPVAAAQAIAKDLGF